MIDFPFGPIDLMAIDATRNIHRRWRMTASRDLFGHILIETSWGRIGTRGRTLIRSFHDDGLALRHIRSLLARRVGAVRRIGVAYR